MSGHQQDRTPEQLQEENARATARDRLPISQQSLPGATTAAEHTEAERVSRDSGLETGERTRHRDRQSP
jgi:hypothetical protein